ncbi:hypothetical protein B0T19DRAFT_399816 [Cercophora scortea]|uniref:Uncharacterized protein n=1 Tax=Cercophora scortea TaxID=314031 RepID=A0AAE0MIZ9_9PEZI|nr:hypothetical protein B0T19DRAFT_399816 [Cercophora scortea]
MPPITSLAGRPENVDHIFGDNLEPPTEFLRQRFAALRRKFGFMVGIPYPNAGLGISYLVFARSPDDNLDRVLIVRQGPKRFKYSHDVGMWELPMIMQFEDDKPIGPSLSFAENLARALEVELGIYCSRYHLTFGFDCESWFKIRTSHFGHGTFFQWTVMVEAKTAHSQPLSIPGDADKRTEVRLPKIERRPASENPLRHAKNLSPYYTDYTWVTEEQCKDGHFADPEDPLNRARLPYSRHTQLHRIFAGFEELRRMRQRQGAQESQGAQAGKEAQEGQEDQGAPEGQEAQEGQGAEEGQEGQAGQGGQGGQGETVSPTLGLCVFDS